MNQPIRILYVDDSPFDRELVRDALEKEQGGFELLEAASRAEFEKKLTKGSFDLVLSDFNILGFEGLQVIERVHTIDSSLPVIIVTGTGSEEVAVEALKRGAADYVIKTPKHIQHLPHIIHAVFEKKQMEEERKQAEEALRESEDKFKYIFDNSVIGKSITLPSGEIHVNKAFCEMLGYSPEELQSKKWQEITHPEDIELTQREVDNLLAGKKKVVRFTKRYLARNGSVVWADISTSLRREKSGKPLYLMTSVTDITERKKTEEALKESENQLSRIFNNVSDVLFVLTVEPNDNFRFISINKRFLEVTGLSEEQILGKPYQKVIPKPAHALVLEKYKKAISKRKTVQWEETSVYPNGVRIGEVFVTPIFDEKGCCTQLIGMVHDITRRRQDEELLRLSEERFRTLFEQAAVGVALLDTKTGQYVRINQKFCDFLGYTIKEMLTKTFRDVTYPDDVQTNIDKNALLLHGTINDFSIEKRYIRKDGTIILGKLTASPLWKPSTKPDTYFHIAVVEDITDRKKSEEKLERSTLELKARNKELERFYKAAVGRELRMIELKKQINELNKKIGQKPSYPIAPKDESTIHRRKKKDL